MNNENNQTGAKFLGDTFYQKLHWESDWDTEDLGFKPGGVVGHYSYNGVNFYIDTETELVLEVWIDEDDEENPRLVREMNKMYRMKGTTHTFVLTGIEEQFDADVVLSSVSLTNAETGQDSKVERMIFDKIFEEVEA